ncbi:MAG: zinc ribbon domain-containing protein [Syntrophomonadaceae bacterium]
MAFFKDLSKKITEGVQDATEKASELVEVQKLNAAINKEKNAIDEAKQQIGDKIFSMHQSGETLPDTLSAEIQTIIIHLQNIAGFEAKIREAKGEAPITPQAQPAPAAPAPTAPPADAPPAAAVKFCPECGAKIPEGSAFCGECGTKVQ